MPLNFLSKKSDKRISWHFKEPAKIYTIWQFQSMISHRTFLRRRDLSLNGANIQGRINGKALFDNFVSNWNFKRKIPFKVKKFSRTEVRNQRGIDVISNELHPPWVLLCVCCVDVKQCDDNHGNIRGNIITSAWPKCQMRQPGQTVKLPRRIWDTDICSF